MVTGSVLIRDKLPAIEIHMGHKVFTPCRFNRRFEGQHEDTLEAHLLYKLIGGKGFAEAHLGIPKELRWSAGIFLRYVGIILHRALNRLVLFRAHFEGGSTAGVGDNSGFQFNDGSFDIRHRAVKPFVAVAALVHLTKSLAAENAMNILIRKDRAIGTHGRLGIKDISSQTAGMHLFINASYCVAICIPNLDIPLMCRDLREVIDINCWGYSRSLYKKFLCHLVRLTFKRPYCGFDKLDFLLSQTVHLVKALIVPFFREVHIRNKTEAFTGNIQRRNSLSQQEAR